MIKKWLPGLIGLSSLALLGRIAGFIREILMASKFGANSSTDAYLTTLILFDLSIAANTAIISATLSYLSQPGRSGKSYEKSLKKISVYVIFAGVTISFISFPFVDWILPHLLGTKYLAINVFGNSVKLLLILFSIVIPCGILSAVLQLKGKISIPGGLTIFLNGFSIIGLIFLSTELGIISIPAGLLIGTILFYIFQFVLSSKNYEKGNQETSLEIFPWIISISLVFINLLLPSIVTLFERYFAFGMIEGTYSHYSYAIKLGLLPLTIFGYAISTSLLPIQTKFIRENNSDEFDRITNYAFLIALISASVLITIIFTFAQPIVKILYEHGKFLPADTSATASVLRIYSLGLFPFLINPILANVFYSFGKTKFLILIGSITTALNILLIILSMQIIAGSIAFATAAVLAGWIYMLVSVIYINAKVKKIFNRKFILSGIIIIPVTLLISFVCYFIFNYLFNEASIYHLKPSEIIIRTLSGILITLIVIIFALGIVVKNIFPELISLIKKVGSK